MRVGGNTGVDLVMLRRDLTGLYVDAGVVRIYNRSADALVRVETRLGYVAAEPGDIVDLYVGDAQIQVIALEGSPNFFYYGRGREEIRYEVVAAGPAIFIDEAVVEAAEPLVDRAWDQWNYERDQHGSRGERFVRLIYRSRCKPTPMFLRPTAAGRGCITAKSTSGVGLPFMWTWPGGPSP